SASDFSEAATPRSYNVRCGGTARAQRADVRRREPRMGDAGEGLIDAESRIQERMDQLELERAQKRGRPVRDPERVRMIESLRLARTELAQQLSVTTHERRRSSLQQAIDELNRRLTEAGPAEIG